MVIEPGESGLDKFELIEEDEYIKYEDQFGYMAVSDEDKDNENYFYATMGGEAMKEMLSRLNIQELKSELVDVVKTSKSKQKRADALKRLKVVQSFVTDSTKKTSQQARMDDCIYFACYPSRVKTSSSA